MKKNIFVMYGTQPFTFSRFDEYVNQIDLEKFNVLVQANDLANIKSGISKINKLEHDELINEIRKADVIISHGGVGSIFDALENGKNPIVIARLQKYNEHVDDHQVELVKKLEDMNLIVSCSGYFNLDFGKTSQTNFAKYESNFKLTEEIKNELTK